MPPPDAAEAGEVTLSLQPADSRAMATADSVRAGNVCRDMHIFLGVRARMLRVAFIAVRPEVFREEDC